MDELFKIKVPKGDFLQQTAEKATLDIDKIHEQVEQILNHKLYWFPVRHHSPVVAHLLQKAIQQRRPKIIFIEAPADAEGMIPHICDNATKPPVAIYSSYCDDENTLGLAGIASPAEDIPVRYSSWYPMLEYSPEFVAIKEAKKLGTTVKFIDLPHYALLQKHKEHDGSNDSDEYEEDKKKIKINGLIEQEDERLLIESGFYQALAKSAGFRNWQEAWDSLFEFGPWKDNLESFRRELTTFCAAARATSSTERMQKDGTFAREAHMITSIRQHLEANNLQEKDAMVVCGGFHLFLDQEAKDFPEAPLGTVYNSLVPYSFFRVSELSGYAAGNHAPQFYQNYWKLIKRKQPEDLLNQHCVETLKQARRLGDALSSADAIAVIQHAHLLAGLRKRNQPILIDLHDALMSCCCKGDPEYEGVPLQQAMDIVDIGRKIGRVTMNVGLLPIVKDYFTCLEELDLKEFMEEEKQIVVKLDKRESFDNCRAVFLHRLRYLKIPAVNFHKDQDQFSGTTLFKERWTLRWSPDIESKLIEENLYGDSIESAVMARLKEEVARHVNSAEDTCRTLVTAIGMELPDLISHLYDKCSYAIAEDSRLLSLARALHQLRMLENFSNLRLLRTGDLKDLIVQVYDRACFAIPASISLPEDQQQDLIEALKIVAEALFSKKNNALDKELFSMHLQSAAANSKIPYLRGAFCGLLAELKVSSPQQVMKTLSSYALAAEDTLIQAGEFLEGLLAVSRSSILIGADELIEAIEELLLVANDDAFMFMLPRLRGAFEGLKRQQISALAQRIAEKHGLKEAAQLLELNTSLEAAALISRIDNEVNIIMKEWEF